MIGRLSIRLKNVKRDDDGRIKSADVSVIKSADGYRLPTEAQWEYACRAGTKTRFSKTRFSFGDNLAGDQANIAYKLGRTTSVGSYEPNDFGLYDMHGNVWEWCWDWYEAGYYRTSRYENPQGAASGSGRVYRGGSFDYTDANSRSASRNRVSARLPVQLPWPPSCLSSTRSSKQVV